MRHTVLASALAVAVLALTACGTSSSTDPVAESCEQAGGTWRGDDARYDEACAVRYGEKTYYLQVDYGDKKVITTGDRSRCREADDFWRSTLRDRAAAAGVPKDKKTRESAIFHADTGICEKTRVPVTSSERRVIAFSRYAHKAENALCGGDGPRARELAGQALAIKDDRRVRRVIADSRTLDEQQAFNRANPASERMPQILVRRCGASDDASGSAGDKDCSDFDTQAEAQASMELQVGDPDRLDEDDDGTACDWLP